jgi:hypothetical protein
MVSITEDIFETRSKLKWVFPFCEKYDQFKETPLKYTIFPSKAKTNLLKCGTLLKYKTTFMFW